MGQRFALALSVAIVGAAACIPDIVPTRLDDTTTGSNGAGAANAGGSTGTSDGGTASTGGGGAGGGSTPGCGDGVVVPPETCDLGDSKSKDGCSSKCQIEEGFACTDGGTKCAPICGDGLVRGDEACDDTRMEDGHGCSADCSTIEEGWACPTEGEDCEPICGDGVLVGDEVCDDKNPQHDGGCSADCLTVVEGFDCSTVGKACKPICGDGIKVAGEACDDGNADSPFGCKKCKQIETGYECLTPGQVCTPICGDGLIVGDEACDDTNQTDGDGCPGDCRAVPLCGNGVLDAGEICDDGNTDSGDGCPTDCLAVEKGWNCPTVGSPCVPICGDGLKVGTEICDDGNGIDNDACTNACARGSIDIAGNGHGLIKGALDLLGETYGDQGLFAHTNGGAGLIINANYSAFDDCSGGCPDYTAKLNAGVHILLVGPNDGAESAAWLSGYLNIDGTTMDWHASSDCTHHWNAEGTHPMTKYMPVTWDFLNANLNGPTTHQVHFTFTQPSGADSLGTTCHNLGAPGVLATRRYSGKGTFTALSFVVGNKGDATSLNNFLLPFLRGYLEYIRSPAP